MTIMSFVSVLMSTISVVVLELPTIVLLIQSVKEIVLHSSFVYFLCKVLLGDERSLLYDHRSLYQLGEDHKELVVLFAPANNEQCIWTIPLVFHDLVFLLAYSDRVRSFQREPHLGFRNKDQIAVSKHQKLVWTRYEQTLLITCRACKERLPRNHRADQLLRDKKLIAR